MVCDSMVLKRLAKSTMQKRLADSLCLASRTNSLDMYPKSILNSESYTAVLYVELYRKPDLRQ